MIKELLDEVLRSVQGTDVVEVEVKTAGHTVRILRSVEGHAPVVTARAAPYPTIGTLASAPQPETANQKPHVIEASMYGTFYRSSSPSQEPFVKEGQKVYRGDQLGVLEAMKTMHAVDSDVSGTVIRILAANGNVVEPGAELFVIEPDKHEEI